MRSLTVAANAIWKYCFCSKKQKNICERFKKEKKNSYIYFWFLDGSYLNYVPKQVSYLLILIKWRRIFIVAFSNKIVLKQFWHSLSLLALHLRKCSRSNNSLSCFSLIPNHFLRFKEQNPTQINPQLNQFFCQKAKKTKQPCEKRKENRKRKNVRITFYALPKPIHNIFFLNTRFIFFLSLLLQNSSFPFFLFLVITL